MLSTQKMGHHQVIVIILQTEEAKVQLFRESNNCTDKIFNAKSPSWAEF